MRYFNIILGTIALLASLFQIDPAYAANRHIVLHLRWDHQYQFAGYYAALWQGYYREVGLDVEIRSAYGPDGKFSSAIDAVANKRADFGIGSADVLTAIDSGAALKIVMPVFQQSPYAFFAKSDIDLRSPADLMDRSLVTRGAEGVVYAELLAMLRAEGLDPSRIKLQEPKEGLALRDVMEDRADVAAGSLLSTGWFAREAGVSFSSLSPASYGIDFYGDSIFAGKDFAAKNPDIVKKFIDASTKGWQYALNSPDIVADRISRTLPRTIPISDIREFNRFQADQVRRLVRFPEIPLGHSNIERWRIMHRMLGEAGLVNQKFDARLFPSSLSDESVDADWIWGLAALGVLGLGASLLLLGISWGRRKSRVRVLGLRQETLDLDLDNFIAESSSPISIRDGQARYVLCNPAWEKWIGLDAERVKGMKLSEVVPAPLDAQSIELDEAKHFEVFRTGIAMKYETSVTRRNGESAVIQINRFPFHNHRGKVVGVGLVLTDITEFKSIESERDASEAQLRTFIDHAPFIVTVRDVAGRYLICNKAWENWSGRTLDEVRGKIAWQSILDVNDPMYDVVRQGRDRIQEVLDRGESLSYDAIEPNFNGEFRSFSITRFPIRDGKGNIVAVGTIAQDQSEYAAMSAEREALQAQIKAFVENAPFAIAIRDTNGRYTSVNEQWERIYGHRSEIVLGKAPWEIITDPNDPKYNVAVEDKALFEQALESGSVSIRERAIADADGNPVTLQVVRFPIRGVDGRIIGIGTMSQDLSDLRRLDADRIRLEAQLRAFINHAPFMVTIRDTEGRYLVCNDPWIEWSGMDMSRIHGRSSWELFDDPNDPMYANAQWDRKKFQEVLESGEAIHNHRAYVGSDGKKTVFSSVRFPIRDDSGTIISVGNIMADQTEMHMLGRAQQTLESQFKEFIENAPITVSIVDLEGRYIAVNRDFRNAGHTLSSDAVGKLPSDFVGATLADGILELNRDVLAQGVAITRELNFTSDDGEDLTLSMTKFPLRDDSGNIVSIGSFSSNVTEARRAELAIEASEARYRALVEMSPEPVVVLDDLTIIYANNISAVWAGKSSAVDLIGHAITEFVAPVDMDRFREIYEMVAQNPDKPASYEIRVRVKGEIVDIAVASGPVEFDGIRGRLLIIRDISMRKQMEIQIHQNAKLATIGELSAGILHELAQPLNIARMAAQGALRRNRKKNNPSEDFGTEFELIENQMARMASVIDHMRVFSRADSPIDEIFDARNSIKSAVDMVRHSFAAEDISIDVQLPSRRSLVRGHSIGLEQVILNLLSNAHDAIADNVSNAAVANPAVGGQISIILKLFPDDRRLEIYISDTGGGIPPEVMPKLFDPFVTSKPAGRGTGLGLSVCRSIINSLSGNLTARNVRNGAEFVIRLPLETLDRFRDERIEFADYQEVDASELVGHGKTALVVDDEPQALQLMADFIDELGFDVSMASDGKTALSCYREQKPDLIVTDIRLPILDGIEFARAVRKNDPDLPIIFVTGHMGVTDRLELLGNQRRLQVIHKPIDLDHLEGAISELLESNTSVLDDKTIN